MHALVLIQLSDRLHFVQGGDPLSFHAVLEMLHPKQLLARPKRKLLHISLGALLSSSAQEWYAVVANAEFFFNDPQNESLAEQLRERVRYFKEINREIDFYLVPEPKWLEQKYPQEAKQIKRPCVALVSTDKTWIV